jgi:hypothetical protein
MPITVSEGGEWVERLAISDLICRYSSAVTRADWEETEALFAPDAIWEIPALGLRNEGPAALRHFLAETIRYDLLLQTAHSPVVRLLGPGQAQAMTTIHELVRGEVLQNSAFASAGTPVNIEQYGIYHDDVAKLDGRGGHAPPLRAGLPAGQWRDGTGGHAPLRPGRRSPGHDIYVVTGAAWAASKSARAPAPPGVDPLSKAKRKKAPSTPYLTHRELNLVRLSKNASEPKATVTSQPSGETGSSPHPKRRGPNQALRPMRGEVRITRIIAPALSLSPPATPRHHRSGRPLSWPDR